MVIGQVHRRDSRQGGSWPIQMGMGDAYQMKYDDLPLEETLAMIDADEPNDDQAKLLAHGTEHLARRAWDGGRWLGAKH